MEAAEPLIKLKTLKKQCFYQVLKWLAMAIAVIVLAYLLISLYFINHFYFNSSINNINVSLKSVTEANSIMVSDLATYELILHGRKKVEEKLNAQNLGLTYQIGDSFEPLVIQQKPLLWGVALIKQQQHQFSAPLMLDTAVLDESLSTLAFLEEQNMQNPIDAKLKYFDGEYIIISEQLGTRVNRERLQKEISTVACAREGVLELENVGCYYEPTHTKASEKVQETKQRLNHFISTSITYPLKQEDITINHELINKWINVSEDLSISFDLNEMKDYLITLSEEKKIELKSFDFMTTSGEIKNIKRGHFSYDIEIDQELSNLVEDIFQGNTVVRQPATTGVGLTYVEIDLSNQHLYLYENGTLVCDDNIVTGNVSQGHTTPEGVYSVKWKTRNRVLRGPGYAAFVKYWMPFNGGIGIHDANWRSRFGGTIYQYDGSHGCINCPHDLAKTVYSVVEQGTPVVCYN